jgi:hypothetical protein
MEQRALKGKTCFDAAGWKYGGRSLSLMPVMLRNYSKFKKSAPCLGSALFSVGGQLKLTLDQLTIKSYYRKHYYLQGLQTKVERS